jgi:hypothetical protein
MKVEPHRPPRLQVRGKFVAAASTVLAAHKLEAVRQAVLDLENVEDINLFMDQLSP